MAEANPQLSKGNESESLFILNNGIGTGRIKSIIARLKVAIDGRFLIRLPKLFHCEMQ